VWARIPLLTAEYATWLPVLNTAIALTIAGHIVLIAWGGRLVREAVFLLLDVFALISVASLLAIFPFDFSSIPVAEGLIEWPVTLGLVITVVVLVISIIVRFVKLVVRAVRG
jgi:hypothetical protein